MAAQTTVIGIDEAGYGPILGPLVVSAAAFRMPGTPQSPDLWDTLQESVGRTASARGSKIPIIDSKRLYTRKDGLARLERSVLAVLAAARGMPPDLRSLLTLLSPDVHQKMHEYPWYRDANPPLPREADAGGIRVAAALLKRDLRAHSIRLAGLWSEVLLEGHYNRLVSGTRNKAVVLSGLTLRLIQRAADAHPQDHLMIYVDKQGARSRYGNLLLRAFDDRRLKVLEEGAETSAYELTGPRTTWRIRFSQAGESHHMPVALGSLVSKYLRELLMACFNRYWTEQVPELRSTAGYYQDGRRFLKDIGPHVRRLGIDKDRLVRQR
jgi:ribonuclease HII